MQPCPTSARSPVEIEVNRIQALIQQGQLEPALAAAQRIRKDFPENRDALYLVAVCQRYLHQVSQALETLAELETHHSRFSRLFQERGHCFVALRDAPQAIASFIRAVNLNPALPASWAKLEVLYKMVGETENSRVAGAHVAKLASLPPEVVTATALFSDGDLVLAEHIIRGYLQSHTDNVEAMRLLARIGMELDVLDDGEQLLEAVLEAAPDYRAARHDYVNVLLRRHKHAKANEEIDKLLASEPGNRAYRTSKAGILVGLGLHEEALQVYRALLNDLLAHVRNSSQADSGFFPARELSQLHLSVGHSLKTLGRQAESIQAYCAATAVRPEFGDAYWSLANLKTYRFGETQVQTMRSQESSAEISREDRWHLCFALGKCLEDQGNFAESFEYYARGNALKKQDSGFTLEAIERVCREQQQVCSASLFERHQGHGFEAPDPIFIVGLPRSGSTLLEQILASHSRVQGTAELADIQHIVLDLSGREMKGGESRYPAVLASLTADDLCRLGRMYIDSTRAYRTGQPYFIDKMPNNFRHIGLIQLILPNAKIIDARREPMACCFSNFKQLFASGQEFTYSLDDIANYYRMYVSLMQHWDAVLPGRVLRVQHEDVVADLEGSVRRILEYCRLPFEPECLEFHKNERSVRTASSEQVRRPIFKEGLDQWRNFEPWLGPLRQALGPMGGAGNARSTEH
ncbi:MAG: sulfotransferase [Steroidobacteraceae bacterium]